VLLLFYPHHRRHSALTAALHPPFCSTQHMPWICPLSRPRPTKLLLLIYYRGPMDQYVHVCFCTPLGTRDFPDFSDEYQTSQMSISTYFCMDSCRRTQSSNKFTDRKASNCIPCSPAIFPPTFAIYSS
jgi:hypothetical protein